MIHTDKGFSVVNETEVDAFLESPCFLCFQQMLAIWSVVPLPFLNPACTSGSSWFTYHLSLAWRILSFALLSWNESNYMVVWTLFGTALLWNWNENWPFSILWPRLSFQICWHIECSTLTASSFRVWKSSSGIPSSPLALFVVMLSKVHLTSHSRMSGYRWVITSSWLSGSWSSFLYSSPCILATSS